EADVPLTRAGAILGLEEAGEDVRRQAGGRVDGLERGPEEPSGAVEGQLDLDVEELAVGGRADGGEVAIVAGRDGQDGGPEPELSELQGGPVKIGRGLVRPVYALHGCGSRVDRHRIAPWPKVLVVDAVGDHFA